MNTASIQELAVQAVDAFRHHGYTERSIGEKEWIFYKIVDRHEKQGKNSYNSGIVNQFVQESERRYEKGEINRTHYRFLAKTATYLTELHDTGTINFAQRFVPRLPDYYESLLAGILVNENWSKKTRDSVWPVAKAYFGWLQKKGCRDLSRVEESVVRQYLISCSSRMVGSSLDTTKRVLKKLYTYLFEIGLSVGTYESLLSFPVPIARKIKRPITHSEIAAVLNIIDRDTAEGKRDYAMILLATVTGLRAVDIVNLKLRDIDWRNGEIRIAQSKTEEFLALPLTTDVGMAVRDYVLNARPESPLASVFLRINAPIREISRAILYGQFNRHRATAGLTKCSFHDLRRSLGSNMVKTGTPVTTVAQVLGHSDIDSTKQYISLDTTYLKECSLDFSGITPNARKGGGA
jgi:site-specific recombinase XerD